MSPLASTLIACAAAVMFALGAVHVAYTFHGARLRPRDAALLARMRTVSPFISRESSMWRAWVGFNASHGFGALLFGAVCGYLAVPHGAFLARSAFLPLLGLVLLCACATLGKRYWFSVPLRAIFLATALHALGLVVDHV